jgi:hypothetical protein
MGIGDWLNGRRSKNSDGEAVTIELSFVGTKHRDGQTLTIDLTPVEGHPELEFLFIAVPPTDILLCGVGLWRGFPPRSS